MNDVQFYIEQVGSEEFQTFLRENENTDEKKVILKGAPLHGIPAVVVATQIVGRRKAKYKLPSFYASPHVVYPSGLNLEQSSSEKTAMFKCSFLKECLPETVSVVDLSSGFGIDSLFFSNLFSAVTCVEPQGELLKISRHNHNVLQGKGIKYIEGTAESFLSSDKANPTIFFIDPSRRVGGDKKVVRLRDCEPDITKLQATIFELSDYLLVKTSPLLDISRATAELKGVCKVAVVSIDNECKELLFLCHQRFSGEPEISAINLFSTERPDEIFSFTSSEEKHTIVDTAEPHSYIYEPNVSLLKAGAFKSVSARTGLKKLHANTHLYTSDSLVESFPGRIFKIMEPLRSDRKSIEKLLPGMKANIILRNYPETVDAVRRKLHLAEGGDDYILGFTTQTQKMLCLALRLK